MKNKQANMHVIKKVAKALQELTEQMVFVGGAVLTLYADDTAAEDVRSTRDVDLFLEITSYGQLNKLQEKLAAKGFYPAHEEDVMCRFIYKDILIDIMSTDKVGWAPADKWFKPALNYLEQHAIDEVKINILNVAFYFATKLNAFHDRKEDPRMSKHFEDIIYILDNRINIVNEIKNSPKEVKQYLISEFKELLKPQYEEAILAHLGYEVQNKRFQILQDRLREIVSE
jgi:predicted nucleotidyltransferase